VPTRDPTPAPMAPVPVPPYSPPSPPGMIYSCMPSVGSTASLPMQPQRFSSAPGERYCTRGYGLMPTQTFPSRFMLGDREVQITDKLERATLAECKAECDRFVNCAGFLRGVDTDNPSAFSRATWFDEVGSKPNRTAICYLKSGFSSELKQDQGWIVYSRNASSLSCQAGCTIPECLLYSPSSQVLIHPCTCPPDTSGNRVLSAPRASVCLPSCVSERVVRAVSRSQHFGAVWAGLQVRTVPPSAGPELCGE
jgi:hypothetical protein